MSFSIPISAVERETGLSKDTLRMWERRYGFPTPARDQFGDRLYPPPQVEKLRLIRRLMDLGFRPGRIISESHETLLEMSNGVAGARPPEDDDHVQDLMQLVATHRVSELRTALQLRGQNMGLRRFVLDLAAPLTRAIGDAWSRGDLAVFEEHLYTEVMQNTLRKWIGEARTGEGRSPRILLATLPNELHGLGLLMAETLMTLDGAECLSCGLQMPVGDIVRAAKAHRADIVTLSFSAAYPRSRISEGLSELRALLPPEVEIWVGGGGLERVKRVPEQVTVVRELWAVSTEIGRWRHASARA
jgi:MerR family transcriptional regulator, light-induced transcriptional regulator